MKYVIIGIIVVIALLAFVLSRRGSTGLGQNGSTDTTAGALGQTRRDSGSAGGLGGGGA
jgi:hypothetical protein